jgi:hypothetical protein
MGTAVVLNSGLSFDGQGKVPMKHVLSMIYLKVKIGNSAVVAALCDEVMSSQEGNAHHGDDGAYDLADVQPFA